MQSWVRIEYVVCATLLVAATLIGLLVRGTTAERGICLSRPLHFADGDVKGCVSAAQAGRLRERKLALGENRDTNGVTLTHPGNMAEQRQVATCSEYDEATAQGWYALTTYDLSMESFFRRDCALIDALSKAAPAKRSFIKEPRVGLNDMDIVSASVLQGFVPIGTPDATLGTLMRAGAFTVDERGPLVLKLSSNNFTATLEELARADFNGDGLEDILVLSAIHAQGGTLRDYETKLLTREDASAPLTLVQ